jgi:hypothetical protein
MSDLVGDTAHLHRRTIPFKIAYTLSGAEGHGHFAIPTANGFKQLAASRASVRIVSDSLRCQVLGPASPSVALEAYVAIVPKDLESWPTKPAQLLTIGGSCYCQHSIYSPSRTVPIEFSAEAAHQIKPTPLVGSAPEVVYYFQAVGGETTTTSYLCLSGLIEVDGIGFTQTW